MANMSATGPNQGRFLTNEEPDEVSDTIWVESREGEEFHDVKAMKKTDKDEVVELTETIWGNPCEPPP